MKRVGLLVGMLWLAGAVCASATIQVTWTWDISGGAGVVDNALVALPAGSIVQLIASTDAIVDPLNTADPLTPTGDDVLMDTRGSAAGGFWSYGDVNFGDGYSGMYVYQRVFDVPLASTPTIGDFYGDGEIMAGAMAPLPATATISALWDSNDGLGTEGNYVVNTPIIPEPATLSLMGLGILSLLGFRRKR